LAQFVLGAIIGVAGIGLLGFATLLIYADIIRDLPSRLVVNTVITLCSVSGMLNFLVGSRLMTGIRTRADAILFSPTVWNLIGASFVTLSVVVLIRFRLVTALAGVVLGLLCVAAGRSLTALSDKDA
jgi:hypothetical protein